MKKLCTRIEIRATAKQVWDVLTDLPRYDEWNPFISKAEGKVAEGEALALTMTPPGGSAFSVKPEVLTADEHREFRWLGHLLIPGIFDGEHSFTIEPVGEGRVRLTQCETFKGLLTPIFKWRILESTRRGFEAMNEALKERVEN
jgi:hypothetical protein